MAEFSIVATSREEIGRKTNVLRTQHLVPAIVYGFGTEPISITVVKNELQKLYAKAGESSVIDLTIDGKIIPVLIKDMQYNPLTDFITHADFYAVDLSKKIEASISIRLSGEAPAVKELGGTLVQSLEEVEVIALPSVLVREFIVDISQLKTYDDVVRVKDLPVISGIEITSNPESAIALVQEPREEEAVIPAGGDTELPEILTEKKDETGETEAGSTDKK